MSEEYEERRNNILANLQKICWDEERGLYREGPNFIQYSQHAQAWAVLNEMGTPEVRKRGGNKHTGDKRDSERCFWSHRDVFGHDCWNTCLPPLYLVFG